MDFLSLEGFLELIFLTRWAPSAAMYDVSGFGGLSSKIKFSIDPSGRELLGRNALWGGASDSVTFSQKSAQGVSFHYAKRELHILSGSRAMTF